MTRAHDALPALVLVEADRVRPQPWKNGGGVTRELLRRPAAGDAWTLRVSLADIDADGPFSPFPGVDRHFAVIAGNGVRLQLRHRVHPLAPGDDPIAFEGEEAPGCTLVDGSTRDLNVMVARAEGSASLARWRVGEAWPGGAAARGVFAVDALRLRRAGDGYGDTHVLPARTLAWCDAADASTWTLEPLHGPDDHPAPLAWRLTFDPTTP